MLKIIIDFIMNPEKILLAAIQEILKPEYLKQFENIKCDEQYYYLYKHLSFDTNLYVLNCLENFN